MENNSVHILVESIAPIASVRVGVLEPLKALGNRCVVQYKETIKIKASDIQWCDILICVRGFESISVEIVRVAREAGKLIVYFLDDDLLNIPSNVPSGRFLQQDWVEVNIKKILSMSHVLWGVNPRIKQLYMKYCSGKWVLGKVPVKIESGVKFSKGFPIKVLYAGSIDHSATIQQWISDPVRRLVSEYGEKVEFTFIGGNPGISDLDAVKYIPFINNYDEYRKIVLEGQFHIGLGIVKDEDFYKGKYYNKFIEYTSIGAIGIYTDSLPYKFIVSNRDNGFLCNNKDWYNTIKFAIEHIDQCERYYMNACQLLKSEYSYSKIEKELLEQFPELITYHTDKTVKVHLKNLRYVFYKEHWFSNRKRYGIFAIPVVFYKAGKILFMGIIRRVKECF